MAVTSLTEARALLFAALDVAGVNATAVTKVYDHEPRVAETAVPAIVTIFATGFDPNEWLYQFAVRIYYETKSTAPSTVQHDMDVIIEAVDDAIAAAGRVGPVVWTIGFADNLDALVAESDVTIGREDL